MEGRDGGRREGRENEEGQSVGESQAEKGR